MGLELIGSFGKLEIQEGDIVILKTDSKLSNEVQLLLKEQIDLYMPFKDMGVKVMILDDGMDIGVIRGEATPIHMDDTPQGD